MDIPRAVSNFRFFAGAIRHASTGAHDMGHAINYTHRGPVGVCGLITPWNLPLYLLSWKVAPALACGNTIVAKPSEVGSDSRDTHTLYILTHALTHWSAQVTPLTANALAEIIHEVGLPKGVFNLVQGGGPNAGNALVGSEDVQLISFTGGTVTGKKVGALAAQTIKKCSLELGGKNATVVFDDCDFDETVAGTVRASFANQGQICLCGSRLFVQKGIYDKFVAAFVAKVQELKPGNPAEANFGSLTSHMHRDKVESYVELAKKNGGTILCGGKRPELPAPFDRGAFLEPTVVGGLSHLDQCAQDEIFGPVITVHPFETEADALKMVNSSRYGLAGSLWTNDLRRAHKFSQKWKTGMVWVNTWLLRDLRVPFGGVGHSGVGNEGGHYSLEFYSEDKNSQCSPHLDTLCLRLCVHMCALSDHVSCSSLSHAVCIKL